MTIWLLVLLLLGLFGSAGAQQGAIRMSIALVGVFLGAFFSFKLDGAAAPLVNMAATNPVWRWLLPPVVVFLGFAVGFGVLAQVVHHKAHLFYTYKADDDLRLRWERLNGRLGTSIGVTMGAVYALLLCIVIQVGGYLTTQLRSPGENPSAINFLNRARMDLASSGMEKLVSALDPTPESVYDTADIFGLVYNNPDLAGRLSQYPLFIAIAEKPEFQDIANDPEYSAMIRNQTNLLAIIDHPKTQAALKSQDLQAGLKLTDVKDIKNFLETGKSPKYDPEKILGRWELDVTGTVQAYAKKNPNAAQADLNRLRAVAMARMQDLAVLVDVLGMFMMKGSQGDVPQFSVFLSDKKAVLPPVLSTNEALQHVLAQGTWKKDGEGYSVKLKSETAEKDALVTIDPQGRLVLSMGSEVLVFSHAQ